MRPLVPRLPAYRAKTQVPAPPGWSVEHIEDLYEPLPTGTRQDGKTSSPAGNVPVLDQTEDGVLGYHNGEPGIDASPEAPVTTFANHTCAMRFVEMPFSVIQNVFPMRGRPNLCTTRYLFYATRGRVSSTDYKGHHPEWRSGYVPLPPLALQATITAVLSVYDDLIENNNRRIKILEEMAQRIYREWFVDFRYPGHEGVPLVDSILGPIPQGWAAVRLDVACDFTSGKPIPASERGAGDTAVFGANGVFGQTTLPPLHSPCSILGKIGSCGALHRSFEPCWVTNNAFAVHPGEISSGNLVWLTLSNIDLSPFVGGAANPYLPLPAFGHLPIAVGPQHVVDTFEQSIGPLFELSRNVRAQIERLSLSRDLLIPRLVSGEIDMTDLDIAMPEAV